MESLRQLVGIYKPAKTSPGELVRPGNFAAGAPWRRNSRGWRRERRRSRFVLGLPTRRSRRHRRLEAEIMSE